MNHINSKFWMRGHFFSTKQIKYFLLVALSILVVGCQFAKKSDEAVEEEVHAKAETLNKQCPITIDKFTRWDGCIGLSGRILQYNFTVFGTIISPELKAKLVSSKIKLIMKDKDLKGLCKQNVTFRYCYKDYQGLDLCSFDILPQDYNKNYFKEKQKAEKEAEKAAIQKQNAKTKQ